jgi:hypothetical protein
MSKSFRRGPVVAAVLSSLIVPCAHGASVSQTGAVAQAYFTDHPTDFGPLPDLQSLTIMLTGSITGNESFTPTLLFGTVPEPGSLMLFSIACAALTQRRRRKSRAAG